MDEPNSSTILIELIKGPWEAQVVLFDGPKLFSDEKSGDPFMSFIKDLRDDLEALEDPFHLVHHW